MVITDCPGYNPGAAGYEREWYYLSQLENHEACSGWCYDGEIALWTHNPTSWDSCSLAAGQTIREKALRNSSRMTTVGFIGFVIAGAAIFLIQEWINRARASGSDVQW